MSAAADHLYLDLLKKALTGSLYEESGWASTETARTPLHRFVHRMLARHSLLLVKRRPFNEALRREGRDWPLFGYTMAGHARLDNVQRCVEAVMADRIPGDFIETGAWRGGTTIFMRALLKVHGDTQRVVWVADSFEGLPRPKNADDGWDYSDVDYLKVSLEQVRANFDRFSLLDDQVRFLKGWFSETLPGAPIERLSLLRLDGDMYSSTMDALTNLYHRMSEGGFVIVDDYHSWPACKKAVDEFRARHGISAPMQDIDWTGAFWRVERALRGS